MPNNYLIRMAGRIHQQLSRLANESGVDWGRALNDLLARLRTIEHHWQLSQQANARGWYAAGTCKNRQILSEASRLGSAVTHLNNQLPPDSTRFEPPSLRTIVEELQQTQDEFEDVTIDLQHGTITVTTRPVILEDIDLGPFSVELAVGRLADRLGSDCFRCVALKPNPAASRSDTVHPHVQDGHLCAGDASVPITSALKGGRIADAFMLIRSVLQTYNEDSPYVSLSNWSGRTCGECGELTDEDRLFVCDSCEQDVCDECYASCDICDCSRCRNCLELDNVSGNLCCAGCRHTCTECDRTVDDENFDVETELCPGCLAQQQANQEQENNHELETESADPAAPTVVKIPSAA